jgi:hypothetical protein
MDWISNLACDSCKDTYCRINNRSEMKEKILEIVQQRGVVSLINNESIAEEITAMVMEFIQWLNFELHDFYRILNQGVYADVNTDKRYDIDYIFNYWLTNIYKK